MASRQLQDSFGKPKRHYTSILWQEVRLTLGVGLSPVMAASHSALGFRKYTLVWMCESLPSFLDPTI